MDSRFNSSTLRPIMKLMKPLSFFLLIVFTFAELTFAEEVSETILLDQEPPKSQLPEVKTDPPLEVDSPNVTDTKLRRSETSYLAQLIYSPFDLLIPSKYGLSVGWHESVNAVWELEYLRGSLSVPILIDDLGNMTDQRVSIVRRSYFKTNSFNISYGVTYFDFSAELGSGYLSGISGGAASQVGQVGVRSLGFNVGLGNKWTIAKDFTVGIEWFAWTQPLFLLEQKASYLDHTTDNESHGKVDDAIRFASYFPRFSFLKVQLGMLF